MPGWVIPAIVCFVVLDAVVVFAVMSRVTNRRGTAAGALGAAVQQNEELTSACAEMLAGSVSPDADAATIANTMTSMRPQLEELLRARGVEPAPALMRVLVRAALKQLGCGPALVSAALTGLGRS